MLGYDDVSVGDNLPGLTTRLRRIDLVMYAGASGDYNPIHWNERMAKAVGLPDVIAHGMLTMATACRIVTEWVGDPGAISSYEARFSRPVVVPDDDEGTEVRIEGQVAEKLSGGRVVVDITATSGDEQVLKHVRAVALLRL